jgi:hypothetical protein
MTRRIPFGTMALFPIPEDTRAHLTAVPERGFDVGAGRGRPLHVEIAGGAVGLVVDTRGRQPFTLPADSAERIAHLETWNQALDLYPGGR